MKWHTQPVRNSMSSLFQEKEKTHNGDIEILTGPHKPIQTFQIHYLKSESNLRKNRKAF